MSEDRRPVPPATLDGGYSARVLSGYGLNPGDTVTIELRTGVAVRFTQGTVVQGLSEVLVMRLDSDQLARIPWPAILTIVDLTIPARHPADL